MVSVSITFWDDHSEGLISKYHIPMHLTRYFDGESVIYDSQDETPTYVPHTEVCQLCDRDFRSASRLEPQFCQYNPINREFGYVAKICRDCYYWIEHKLGSKSLPKSTKQAISSGHKPVRFDYLFE